jgi:hypothetical protein
MRHINQSLHRPHSIQTSIPKEHTKGPLSYSYSHSKMTMKKIAVERLPYPNVLDIDENGVEVLEP